MKVSPISKVRQNIASKVAYVMLKNGCAELLVSTVKVNGDVTKEYDEIVEFFEEKIKEFGKNAVGHLFFCCWDPDVTDEIFKKLDSRIYEELKLTESSHITARHHDTSQPHCHSLMIPFQFEACFGDKQLIPEEFKRIPVKVFNETYKENKEKLNRKCGEIARKLEAEFDLQRQSITILVSKDGFIKPEYSIKNHFRISIDKAVERSASLNDFKENVIQTGKEVFSTFINKLKDEGRTKLLMRVGDIPEISFSERIQKNGEIEFMYEINGFKCRGFKLGENYSLRNITKQLEANSKFPLERLSAEEFVKPKPENYGGTDSNLGVLRGLNQSFQRSSQPEIRQTLNKNPSTKINPSAVIKQDHNNGIDELIRKANGLVLLLFNRLQELIRLQEQSRREEKIKAEEKEKLEKMRIKELELINQKETNMFVNDLNKDASIDSIFSNIKRTVFKFLRPFLPEIGIRKETHENVTTAGTKLEVRNRVVNGATIHKNIVKDKSGTKKNVNPAILSAEQMFKELSKKYPDDMFISQPIEDNEKRRSSKKGLSY